MTTAHRKHPGRYDPEVYFALYAGLGAGRSLNGVLDLCRAAGVKAPGVSTINGWSQRYGWLERVREYEESLRQASATEVVDSLAAMNDRQANLGRALQAAAALGLANMRQADPRLLNLKPEGMATLAKEGARLERLALGEATERTEIISRLANIVIVEIAVLFDRINGTDTPEAQRRRADFAFGVDAIMGRFAIEAESQPAAGAA